jgi:broad specificity phosphatase PhoE
MGNSTYLPFNTNKQKIFKSIVVAAFISSYFLLKPLTESIASYLERRLMERKKNQRPKRVILIRHGQSEGNVDEKIYIDTPDNKLKLSELGVQQALSAGKKLKEILGEKENIKFYVSPFLRTKQTFEHIIKSFDKNQYTYIEDPRLREQEWGNYQDPSIFSKIKEERKKVGRFYYRFPTGESGADVYDRASLFLTSFFRLVDCETKKKQKHSYQNVVIVTHGLFIQLFLMRYFKWTVEEFDKLDNPKNCEIIILEKDNKGSYSLCVEIRKNNN